MGVQSGLLKHGYIMVYNPKNVIIYDILSSRLISPHSAGVVLSYLVGAAKISTKSYEKVNESDPCQIQCGYGVEMTKPRKTCLLQTCYTGSIYTNINVTINTKYIQIFTSITHRRRVLPRH